MIRLFSSFDLFFFKFSRISFLGFPLLLGYTYWFNSPLVLLKIFFTNFMSSFFSRILIFKSKSFNTIVLRLMSLLFILNFLSIFPWIFSFTSQVSLNLFWGLSLWLGLFIFSVCSNFKQVLSHFVPEGTPLFLIWFLFIVEVVRLGIRPITLVVRLLANILAGHLLIILLSKLVFLLSPFFFLYILLNLVEFFVSGIQSYIFVTIICLYFSEVS